MEITSVNNKLIKEMSKLHKKKYRDLHDLFLVEGYHLYEEALKVNNIKYVFTTNYEIQGQYVYYVSSDVLEKLAQIKSPQGIVTICHKIKKHDVTDRVLLLEKIQDPGNLGTLLRSALAFGFQTVVLDQTVDLYNEKVLRSTQGALHKLNIIEEDAITFVTNHPGHTLYGTSMNGEQLSVIDSSKPLIVALGNEGSGVSKELLNRAVKNVTIDTVEVDSLNVGVAGSIIMHSIRR